jgi:hypothetical protein
VRNSKKLEKPFDKEPLVGEDVNFWVHDGINNNKGCEPSIDGFIPSIPRKSLTNHQPGQFVGVKS